MKTFEEYIAESRLVLKTRYVDSSDAFIKAFYAKGVKSKDGVKIRADGTTVFVNLLSFNDAVYISEISLPNDAQGKGTGHKVMKMLTELADEMKVTLGLLPKPITQAPDEPQISKTKLVSFYQKHGFDWSGQKMIRRPQ